MFSFQLEQLARQRSGELARAAARIRIAPGRRAARHVLRNEAGWALVAIGLRIAESGNRGRR